MDFALPAPPPQATPPAGAISPTAADAPANSTDQPSFLPATQFGGARSGYAFRQGPQGLGYYRDDGRARTAGSAKAAAGEPADSDHATGMQAINQHHSAATETKS